MDPLNPYCQSSGFLDLLHSQGEDTAYTNPYASMSPSNFMGSSEVPAFSTQASDEESEGEATTKKGVSRKKWSPKEDVVLISVWLNTSKDPVIGNDQKGNSFWKRIAAYVASSPQLDGLPKREHGRCKQRWGKINEAVNKFVGCYGAAAKQKASGQSEDDVMKMAHQLYFNDKQKKFTLDHAWRELRYDQKWCGVPATKETSTSKRRKAADGSAYSASSQPTSVGEEEVMRRPPGVKAAKAKGKKAATVKGEDADVLNTFQSMWEIRQKDAALQKEHDKAKLLDSLLGRTELSDIEIALKNKLIGEMLS